MIALGVLLSWLVRELGRAPVLAAQVAAGRKVRDMRIPIALSVALSLAGVGLMVNLLGGERARRAETMAAQKLGTEYRYHTQSMRIASGSKGTGVSASVAAWNRVAVIDVPVQWQE